MSRATVRKVFVTGLVVWVVGLVLYLISAGQDANGTLHSAGSILAAIGGVIMLVSWILALISSAMLGRWGWFVVTLILGLLVLPVMMIIYSLAGPTQRRVLRPTLA